MTPGTAPPRTATATASAPVGQLRVVILAQREPQHPARSHVQHAVQVQLALTGIDIGAVAVPLLVDLPGREVPLDQVRCALACCRPFPGRVVPLRLFFGRAARPSSAITAATVFLLTRQPRSWRSAVIIGDPRLPLCASNSRLTSAFSRSRRARRGEAPPCRHL